MAAFTAECTHTDTVHRKKEENGVVLLATSIKTNKHNTTYIINNNNKRTAKQQCWNSIIFTAPALYTPSERKSALQWCPLLYILTVTCDSLMVNSHTLQKYELLFLPQKYFQFNMVRDHNNVIHKMCNAKILNKCYPQQMRMSNCYTRLQWIAI